MAEYWEDWSGYSIGDDPTVDGPAGWTRRWHADEAVTIVDISADSPPSGYSRALKINPTGSDRRVYSLDAVDSDADRATVKVAILARPNIGSGGEATFGGVAARGSGTTTSETGLNGTFTTDNVGRNTFNLGQYSSASFTDDLKSVTGNIWSLDTWYWLVVEFDGTASTLTLYPENDPGGTPVANGTHSRTGLSVTSAGWVGLFAFVDSPDLDVAAVNIATGATELSYAAPAGTTPVSFSGTVPTQSLTQDEAMTPLDLSTYFSGSETPFTYAVQTGTLPAGLSLNTSTGVISGTPTGTGTESIVVRATDSGTDTADTNSFDITVSAAVVVVEGVEITLYSGETAQASITDVHYLVTSGEGPEAAELVSGIAESTDASGILSIDLSATSAEVDDVVYVCAFKRDATTDTDSLGWQGMVSVTDIA